MGGLYTGYILRTFLATLSASLGNHDDDGNKKTKSKQVQYLLDFLAKLDQSGTPPYNVIVVLKALCHGSPVHFV